VVVIYTFSQNWGSGCFRKNCSSRLSRDYGEFFSEIRSEDLEGNGNTDGREIPFFGTRKTVLRVGLLE